MRKKFVFNNIQNKSPNCVLLDDIKGKHHSKHKFSISVTLNFNEETSDLPGGHIRYGLNRATLNLELDGCSMPLQDRKLLSELQTEILVERSHRTLLSNSSSASKEANISAELSKKISHKLITKSSSNLNEGLVNEITDKFDTLVASISASGDKCKPQWHFNNVTKTPYLVGCITNEALGLVTISHLPSKIKAFIKVLPRDVTITASDGIWPNEHNANKHAVARALIWHMHLKKKLTPYVSEAELSCESHE